MRVLLVVATRLYRESLAPFLSNTDFPAGFPYLAAALRAAGHEVFGLNPNNCRDYRSGYEMLRDKLTRMIQECQPELIGLGGLCIDYEFLKHAIRLCRELAPDVPIVCGGGIITNDAAFAFDALRPDFCIIGEGEEVMVQLAGMLQGGDKDFDQVPNLGYRKDGRAVFTKENFIYPDIDSRAFPAYEPFGISEMLDHYSFAARPLYRYPRLNPRPMTVVTARSCPFKCTFCVHRRGPRYRARSVANIMQELEQMHDRYHFNILIILDELFAVKRARLQEFCDAVLERRRTLGWDFNWCFQTHASAALTAADMKLAKAAGCYFFSYGMESASPRVLASMNKRTKPSQIADAIQRAHEAQVGFGGNFIFGDPAETAETITETMTFFREHCRDVHVSLAPVQPYPGSRIFEDCVERGRIPDKLGFYERNCSDAVNMTTLPDDVWTSWNRAVSELNAALAWTRRVEADACARETGPDAIPKAALPGQFLYRVTARCPHCGAEVHYREILSDVTRGWKRLPLSRIVVIGRREGVRLPVYLAQKVLTRFARTWHSLTAPARRLVASNLGQLTPDGRQANDLLRLVEGLEDKGGPAGTGFATGCPNCNKRIRVNIGKATVLS